MIRYITYCKRLARVLAHNVRTAREELGYTQAQVARMAGISVRQYHKIENESTNPSIQTICRLSEVFGATPDELMRISRLRTMASYEEYLEQFRSKFENESIGAGIRTLTGVVLWGNKATDKHRASEKLGLPAPPAARPIELLKVMKGPALEILKSQLVCEQRGLVIPYTNFITDPSTGDRTYIRYYPALVLPEKGKHPYFAALYVTLPEEDGRAGYYRFCDRLLSIN